MLKGHWSLSVLVFSDAKVHFIFLLQTKTQIFYYNIMILLPFWIIKKLKHCRKWQKKNSRCWALHREFFHSILMQLDTPIEMPMVAKITLYFTKSKWAFQKHKELSRKYPALPEILLKHFCDNAGHFCNNCLHFFNISSRSCLLIGYLSAQSMVGLSSVTVRT